MLKHVMLFLTAVLITGCAYLPPLIPLPTPDAGLHYYHHNHYYHHRHLYVR